MAQAFTLFGTWFWNDDFWLPPNITWQDINPNGNSKITYADFDHLYVYPWILVVCIFIYRYLFEGFVFRFIGHKLGVKGHKKLKSNIEINGLIENEFKAVKRWDHEQILRLSQKINLPERKGPVQNIYYSCAYSKLYEYLVVA